jgi:hypothetical protein
MNHPAEEYEEIAVRRTNCVTSDKKGQVPNPAN